MTTIEHTLYKQPVPDTSGRALWIGSCSCQAMTPTPAWEAEAIAEAHQLHVELVAVLAQHAAAAENGRASR
ncbi:hypothetical protein [Nocardia sp. NPDC051832]|uniref:hypothetical protein n=1 Tax=Nocardia sp. NPDC051832 TaxID=3155673 RepID=UPI00341836E9